jgi:putative membrane protein
MMWGFAHGLGLFLPFLLFGKVFWIVFLVLLIWSLIRLFTRRRYMHMPPYYTHGTPPTQPSALEILRQRYARGEIDAATYENMRERLENSGGPGPQ